MRNKLLLSLLTLILIGCGGGGGGGGTTKDPLSITTADYTLSGILPTVAADVSVKINDTIVATIDGNTWTATVAEPGTYLVTLMIDGSPEVEKTVIITEK